MAKSKPKLKEKRAAVELREKFSSISKQFEDLKISHSEWRKVVSSRRNIDLIFENHYATLAVLYVKIAVAAVVALFFFLLLFFVIYTTGVIPNDGLLGRAHHMISRFYVERIDDTNLTSEYCIIPFVEPMQDLFRPPVDCKMCSDLSAIDIRVNLSTDEFKERYAYSSRPLVVTDGMVGWTALDTFSFEYLKKVYAPGSKALKSVEDDCQFFPYSTSFDTLGDVFNMTVDEAYLREESTSKPWYIGWSNCDSSAANKLRKHYNKPYFLPDDSESSKVDWIFMGSPGYGAPNHIDAVDLPSWQAQVKGHKIWTLTPPPECYFECGSSDMSVTLHPGYIVIVDTNSWFHSTKVVGGEMSITIGSEYD